MDDLGLKETVLVALSSQGIEVRASPVRLTRYFVVFEIYREGKWVRVGGGSAIGHKKIDAFPRSTASRVRLNILSSSGEAHIREFQILDGESGR